MSIRNTKGVEQPAQPPVKGPSPLPEFARTDEPWLWGHGGDEGADNENKRHEETGYPGEGSRFWGQPVPVWREEGPLYEGVVNSSS
jgi:hypothetical protein